MPGLKDISTTNLEFQEYFNYIGATCKFKNTKQLISPHSVFSSSEKKTSGFISLRNSPRIIDYKNI